MQTQQTKSPEKKGCAAVDMAAVHPFSCVRQEKTYCLMKKAKNEWNARQPSQCLGAEMTVFLCTGDDETVGFAVNFYTKSGDLLTCFLAIRLYLCYVYFKVCEGWDNVILPAELS